MLKRLLLNNNFIAFIILINTVILFLDAFDVVQQNFPWLYKLDIIINIILIAEMIIKIKTLKWTAYIKNDWNKLDFIINMVLILSLLPIFYEKSNLLFLTVLRSIRVVKFFRFFKFIPNINHILRGIQRSIQSSLFVFCALILYLFIISILSCFMFKEVDAELFGNPFTSFYTTFKLFTVEGWYEISDRIADEFNQVKSFFVKLYFMFIVLSGGIFGFSIVNAIFVDEMIADNNDELVKKVDELHSKIDELSHHIKNSSDIQSS